MSKKMLANYVFLVFLRPLNLDGNCFFYASFIMLKCRFSIINLDNDIYNCLHSEFTGPMKCPCCSEPLLRHARHGRIYWFCTHCWQEMPDLELGADKSHQVTTMGQQKSMAHHKELIGSASLR
jgi:ribosomal protein L37AE/L43A